MQYFFGFCAVSISCRQSNQTVISTTDVASHNVTSWCRKDFPFQNYIYYTQNRANIQKKSLMGIIPYPKVQTTTYIEWGRIWIFCILCVREQIYTTCFFYKLSKKNTGTGSCGIGPFSSLSSKTWHPYYPTTRRKFTGLMHNNCMSLHYR